MGVYSETFIHHFNIPLAHSFTRPCMISSSSAKHIIDGRLFRNIHPSFQYSSRSLIHASLYDFFLLLPSTSLRVVYSETFIHHFNIPLAHSFTRPCMISSSSAKHIIDGRLFRNIHPSFQYSSRSLIHASLYDFFLLLPSTSLRVVYSETFIHHFNIPLAHSFTRPYMIFSSSAKHIIEGRLFRNIHPSFQYFSRSLIHASLYDFFFFCQAHH